VNAASSPPAGNIGTAYEFGPSGTTFSQPVTISISYNQADLPSTVTESSLKLGALISNRWTEVADSTVDVAAHVVTGTTTHFSVYGVMPRAWRSVAIESGSAGGTDVVVDATGRVHVIYGRLSGGPSNPSLQYATCASNCLTATNWTSVTITSDAGHYGGQGSLAVDANGSVHFVYYYYFSDQANLVYWSCASNCTSATGWSAVTLDNIGSVDATNSLAIDANGRLHVAYYQNSDPSNGDGKLKYATCSANCSSLGGWSLGVIDGPFHYSGGAGVTGGEASMVVDQNGVLHVFYSI
jgi:hypothetical protein